MSLRLQVWGIGEAIVRQLLATFFWSGSLILSLATIYFCFRYILKSRPGMLRLALVPYLFAVAVEIVVRYSRLQL